MAIGTTRNLTPQFLKLRDDARRALGLGQKNEDKATARLVGAALEGGSSAPAEQYDDSHTSPLAPSWLHKSEKIRAEMSILKERLFKLKEAHSKALLVTFDSDNDKGQAHVDAITRDIQGTFRRLDAEIRAVNTGPTPMGEDADVKLQVQRQLAQALLKLTVEFRKEQTRFLNKKEAQKGIKVGGTLGLVESDSQMNLSENDPGFNQAQLAMVDVSNALAEERDKEIRKIVETITELAQIMKDLSTLVIEQGTILDRIDRNVETTAVKIEEGVGQLVQAHKTQKTGRMMMCILGLIVAIVFLLIIVIVRHH